MAQHVSITANINAQYGRSTADLAIFLLFEDDF